jgi:uncharacterized Zn finger protein
MTAKKAKPCIHEKQHSGHICELESQQEWDIIKKVTDQPTVQCENCGNRANSAKNVCMPGELY